MTDIYMFIIITLGTWKALDIGLWCAKYLLKELKEVQNDEN